MKTETREALDAYYREGDSWAADRIAALKGSHRTAWIVATIAIAIAFFEAIALIVLTPLKTTVPYTLLVDRHTGYVQALDPLEAGRIAPDRALTQSFLVQYVIARESFDINNLQENYRKVGLWSADTAQSQYVSAMQATNPDSPLNRFSRRTVIESRVRSVSPLGDNRALVRFETIQRDHRGALRGANSWVAILRYRFTGEPMRVEDRFLNPLGFQVVHYRTDPETVQTPLPTGQPTASSPTSEVGPR